MTQLPGQLESESSYDDEPQTGQRENQSLSAQQTLLKIVNAEMYLQKSLHGQCTIARSDLEWFGPSLPVCITNELGVFTKAYMAARFSIGSLAIFRLNRRLAPILQKMAERITQI